MARDFIKVDTSTVTATQARLLLNYVQTLRSAYELGVKCKAVMDHNQDGSVFTDIEALFGLPSGKGQTVYNFVNGSIGAMGGTFQNADAKNLTEQVG
jgi:hypothetical protein